MITSETLTRLYQTPVEVLRTSDGRLVVVGQPEAPPMHAGRHADRRCVMTAGFSWNLLADIRDLWSFPFMVNAFRAGTVVAVVAGLIGWFMVLRRQTFAGHTLSVVASPARPARPCSGSARATATSRSASPPRWSSRIATRGRDPRAAWPRVGDDRHGAGLRARLRAAVRQSLPGFLNGITALLFGSFLGITDGQV